MFTEQAMELVGSGQQIDGDAFENLQVNDKSQVKEISRLIRRWLEVSTKRSQRLLAYRTGVSVSTINRFLLDKIPDDKPPAFDLVLKLLKEIASKEETLVFMNSYMGDTGKLMMDILASDQKTKSDITYDNDQITRNLRDPLSFRIITLASNHCGTSANELQRLMGDDAVVRMRELVESELLYMNAQGKVFNVTPEMGVNDWSTLSQMSHFAADALQRRGFGAVFVQTEALNMEGVKRITEILVQAREAIKEVRTSSDYQGTISCIANLSLARLD